jgi:ABC-type Mn2+/Zn2+ transport system permease subunit
MKMQYKLVIVFITALLLELNSIAGFNYLMHKNWIGMFLMAFVNPMITLPMNHFSIECKTFKERFYIAITFALGFGIGVIAIRPFII